MLLGVLEHQFRIMSRHKRRYVEIHNSHPPPRPDTHIHLAQLTRRNPHTHQTRYIRSLTTDTKEVNPSTLLSDTELPAKPRRGTEIPTRRAQSRRSRGRNRYGGSRPNHLKAKRSKCQNGQWRHQRSQLWNRRRVHLSSLREMGKGMEGVQDDIPRLRQKL